ncbi:hypothetical protein, partial [Streptomyces sp. DT190]|uniref:hypothetical protein n=1 Tax=Streptomyces sp. DT190 TaxID=3416527 RepID=UPI003CF49462
LGHADTAEVMVDGHGQELFVAELAVVACDSGWRCRKGEAGGHQRGRTHTAHGYCPAVHANSDQSVGGKVPKAVFLAASG